MNKLSHEERGKQLDESRIIRLVSAVREKNDEVAFLELKKYLEFYVKLFGSKYRISGCDADEIEQECWTALRFKAIEDFNHLRGKFRSFAILCIRRHLFSIIKGNNQQKRRVLNESLSLDADRSEDGENLSLAALIVNTGAASDEIIVRAENNENKSRRLLARLSKLEKEVFKYYIQQFSYEEIVEAIKNDFPERDISKKCIDNSLQRCRSKAQSLAKSLDFEE